MRLRNTLLLAAAFALLLAYLYFFELEKESGGKTERILHFKAEEAESITFSYPHQEIRLQRDSSGKWKVMHPVEAAADESAVRDILSTLGASEINRILEKKPSPEDLKAFGLSPPEVKVLITLRNGKSLPALLIGTKTPVGNAAYAQRGNELAVFLTSGALRSGLEKRLADFLSEEKKAEKGEALENR